MRQAQPPVRPQPIDPSRLKILVVGTPKTGNTWLKHLLSVAYDLPIVDVDVGHDPAALARLGPRWIAQQHFDPIPALLDWAEREQAIFVAPVRHPGDVLVSLRHYLTNRRVAPTDNPLEPGIMLRDPAGEYGEYTRIFLRHGFPLLLHLSIAWLRGGWAHTVRYQDLWQFPLETLGSLTDAILPVPARTLQHALCACEVGLMRATVNPSGDLVRKGGNGSWREELPAAIKAQLATEEPYAEQFAALGFSMDEDAPDNQRAPAPAPVENPFRGQGQFANGVPIAPLFLRIYFDLPRAQTDRWPDATAVSAGSYHEWLRQPAAADPHGGRVTPIVTELALCLRERRPDLQTAFADPFGADRLRFCHWFVFNAVSEFQFDRSFTLPVLASWARG
jgi:hypothetical protein